MDLREIKKALRERMKKARQEAYEAQPDAASLLRDLFIANVNLPPESLVAGYCPIEHELPPAPLLVTLHQKGHQLALPVVTGKGTSLVFRQYAPDDDLIAGSLNVLEPLTSQQAVKPDTLLMPLLAFDRRGHRLGYGGGYYDRTLSLYERNGWPLRTIGIAFAIQEVEAVPIGRYDRPLDAIVTEKELIALKS